MEFDALWHSWDEVKHELTSKNVNKLWVTHPRALPARKPKGVFRVVHQLEPVDALIYTALAYQVAPDVENARIAADQRVACSYRLNVADGNFFASGTGYTDFTSKTEELALAYEYVLTTDITDFYNQIYLHRLNSAIEDANPTLKPVGDDIEWFITTLNNKSSQGIPVGPAASIVMAEAIMVDIDQFLLGRGMPHTRYVDDIRVFSNSERSLSKILQDLTLYLYEQHRLTLSGEKTEILPATRFVEQHLHNSYAEERLKIFRSLEIFNPYADEYDESSFEEEDEDTLLRRKLLEVTTRILEFEHLDLGLARSVIRRARRNNVAELIEPILANFSFFSPVINDVALYLAEVTDDESCGRLTPQLGSIIQSEVSDNGLVRFWMEWYLSRSPIFQRDNDIRSFLYSSRNIENQARAAVISRNLTWVREKKNEIYNLGTWGRRAVLYSSQILPGDEKRHWLRMTIGSTPILADKWVAKWILETT